MFLYIVVVLLIVVFGWAVLFCYIDLYKRVGVLEYRNRVKDVTIISIHATRPAFAVRGTILYETDTGEFFKYVNGQWEPYV